MTADTNVRAIEIASGLRQLAAYLEDHPDLVDATTIAPRLIKLCWDSETFGDWARRIGRAEKSADEMWLNLTRTFTGGVGIEVSAMKQVTCEKVVVGTRKVVQEIYPDDVTPTLVEIDEDITEWRCPDSFLALADPKAAHLAGIEVAP